MNSATLTKRGGHQQRPQTATRPVVDVADDTPAQPGRFFLIAALAVAAAAVVLLRGQQPAGLGLILATLCAAALVGIAFFQTIGPLVGLGGDGPALTGGRARAALERDKALTLRAIKELEFDRAMGKVSEPDFIEMRDRLRARALRLLRQLDGVGLYRQMIERELQTRLEASSHHATSGAPLMPGRPSAETRSTVTASTCVACGTTNDLDARFCKRCGERLATGDA
jgi:hypothetical protein